jgi:hypothetical protein
MIAVYGTLQRVPIPIVAVYLAALVLGGVLSLFGIKEEKKFVTHTDD